MDWISPKILMLKIYSQCDRIWREGFKEVLNAKLEHNVGS